LLRRTVLSEPLASGFVGATDSVGQSNRHVDGDGGFGIRSEDLTERIVDVPVNSTADERGRDPT
jgi:hypothetical protein